MSKAEDGEPFVGCRELAGGEFADDGCVSTEASIVNGGDIRWIYQREESVQVLC